MKRRAIRRFHFAPLPQQAVAVAVAYAPRRAVMEHISKVFGASPAIVFDPMPPIASITKPFKKRANSYEALKEKFGYAKARNIMMMRGYDCDHTHGYDDGEWPEPRHR